MIKLQLAPKTVTTKKVSIALPSSKSESNRALIINALNHNSSIITNLSEARDTQTLIELLSSSAEKADVKDAGTTMRFLTAFFAIQNKKKILTGTPRMQERPIGILVDALRKLGVVINYQHKEGFPPLIINGFTYSGVNSISIRGDVSSQFISALLMIAPVLPEGLILNLEGAVSSRSYIEMTLAQMSHFGVNHEVNWEQKYINIPNQSYKKGTFSVESDWSGASYWYSVMALSEGDFSIELVGLKPQSLQGDSVLVELMNPLGVQTQFTERGLLLTKKDCVNALTWDFSNCPDIAQTVAVICVLKDCKLSLTGIESLKVKETDRIFALQNELLKIGGKLKEVEKNHRYTVEKINSAEQNPVIKTYDDHRMAMAFAPIAMKMSLQIEDPEVVQKSYPSFWEDFKQVAFVEELTL